MSNDKPVAMEEESMLLELQIEEMEEVIAPGVTLSE